MKNLRFKIMLLLVLLAAGVVVGVFSLREPSTRGRTLSAWLRLGLETKSTSDRIDVTNAVREIGVEGIPVLLDQLRAQQPDWRYKLDTAWGQKVFSERWLNAANIQHDQALYGFSILGAQAAPAIPELARMLSDHDSAIESGIALGFIGPASLPTLRAALTNRGSTLIGCVEVIRTSPDLARSMAPDIVAMRTRMTGNNLEFLLPKLAKVLPDEDLLPLAVEFLRDRRPNVQAVALGCLEEVKSNTVAAVPVVVPYLTNANVGLRLQASNTLRRLDPVAAFARGVNTNPLPRRPRGAGR